MYTDGAYHNLEYFSLIYGEAGVTAENFQSEVSKGIYKFSGSWNLDDIKDEANVVEYTMFNSEEQIIYNETVPILRDGLRGDKGEDGTPGKNAVSYKISMPLVYKDDETPTATFYRIEEGKRVETEYYFKVFGLNESEEYEEISSGHDTQASFSPVKSSGYIYKKIKIVIYYDATYLEDLDTEYTELITDGINAVSKFYEISCPVVAKDGDRPLFKFYINEDGKRTPASVFYKIYKNGTIVTSSTSKSESYQWDSVIHDSDEIISLRCEIYSSLDAETPLDYEEIEYLKDGDDAVTIHCLNDGLQLACNEFGKLKNALSQDVTVELYKGTQSIIPNNLTVEVEPSQLSTYLSYTIPSELGYSNNIHLSMNNGVPSGDKVELQGGTVTITATYDAVDYKKVISIAAVKDGENAFSVHTEGDTISLNCDEDSKLKSRLSDTIAIQVLYGDLNINDYATVSLVSSSTVKNTNLNVGAWNKTNGQITLTQEENTTAIPGKLTYKVTVNYMGINRTFNVVFPIGVTKDGTNVVEYHIKGSGLYTLDTPVEYKFCKKVGNNSTEIDCFFTAEWSDYANSAFQVFATDQGSAKGSFTLNAQSNYNRVRITTYSDLNHTQMLDQEIFYLATQSPQVVIVNNFQNIPTDADYVTSGVTSITLKFYGVFNQERTSVVCKTSEISWPEGFVFQSTSAATKTEDGTLTFIVTKGTELNDVSEGYGSIPIPLEMNGKIYRCSFTYAPMSDAYNRYYLQLNADQIQYDLNNNEVFPDMIYPNVIHETSRFQSMINKENYNKNVTDEDNKLRIRALSVPSLKEVYVTYNKASGYTANTQYYGTVRPKYAKGYKDGAVDNNLAWTIKTKLDDNTTKEYVMVFYIPVKN